MQNGELIMIEKIRSLIKKMFKVEIIEPYIHFQIWGIKCRYASKYKKLSYQITQEALWMHEKIDNELKRFTPVDYAKIMNIVEESLSTYALHQQTFLPYKNKYEGKNVVLCGSGPTINKYEPIEGAIHVALNRTFTYEKVKFDYIFIQDSRSLQEDTITKLAEYRKGECIKFIGTQNGNLETEISESDAIKCGGERYNTDGFIWNLGGGGELIKDISTRSIGNFNTVAFSAMQFILYTNPAKIYIVGCDSSRVGHFDKVEQTEYNKNELDNIYGIIVEQWKKVKSFADFYYPKTEIISINPVGLKGIFKDEYTEEGKNSDAR